MGRKRALRRIVKAGDWIFNTGKSKVRAGIISIVGIIVATAADRYFGSPVMNKIEYFWQNYVEIFLVDLIYRIINYPVETSIVTLAFTVAILVVLAFWETRDPHDVFPEKIINGSDAENIIIHNESGNHLNDYAVWVTSIDNMKCNYQIAPIDYSVAWKLSPLDKPGSREKAEFRNATTIEVNLYSTLRLIMEINNINDEELAIGLHNLDIKFHAFNKNNNLVELIIYSVVEVKRIFENKKEHIVVFVKDFST